MRIMPERPLSQPAIGVITTGLVGVGVAAITVVGRETVGPKSLPMLAMAMGLLLALTLTYQFPVHIGPHTKIYLNTVPMYLLAVLTAPYLAALCACLGIAVGASLARKGLDLYPSDIATAGARAGFIVLVGSLLYHASWGHDLAVAALVVAAAVMWIGEIATSPLVLCPISGDPPLQTMAMVLREAGPSEAAQYFVGLLGALLAAQAPWSLVLLALPAAGIYAVLKRLKELRDSTRRMLEDLADQIDLRDPYTGGHSRRVAALCAQILRSMGIQGKEVDLVVQAGRVHDIGKMYIPIDILEKTSGLTEEEWEVMKTHPARGAEILERYADFRRGVAAVRHHHEAWDGSGYPDGLRGKAIPLGARVIAVADSYDAMTSDRPYRAGMSVERAAAILREGRGRQWDPEIVDAFLKSLETREEAANLVGSALQPLEAAG